MSNAAAHTTGLYARRDENGNDVVAKKIGLRLKEFWTANPAKDGWSITCASQVSALTLPGDGVQYPCALFQCTITHAGTAVAQGSSLQPITGEKSWEMGETNAVSRALNFLGFGSQDIEADEVKQIEQMQKRFDSKDNAPKATPTAVPHPSEPAKPQPPETKSHKDDFPDPVKPKVSDTPVQDITSFGVKQAVFNQTVQRAKILGMPVPDAFASREAFEDWRKQVLKGKAGGP